MKPERKPINPNFSSGPCSKYPGFSVDVLKDNPFGRSHRSSLGKSKLQEAINKTKKILRIPDNYLVGIVPGSDTGAIEMAMWNVLGKTGVDVIYFESFGKGWYNDIKNQLKIENINLHEADYGKLPDLSKIDFNNDVIFTWNGTTSGVKVPNGDWISNDRKGLVISDATSAVFAMDIPWNKIDILTFSWQKCLGGEGAHGMIVLSPRAVERIEDYTPSWPIPKIFLLKKKGKIDDKLFEGSTINTPSMLCNEDYLQALNWSEKIGGVDKLIEISMNNLEVIEKFVENRNWIEFLAVNKEIRSNTSVCLKIDLEADKVKKIAKILDDEEVAFDCASYRDAPAGLRFWCGPTMDKESIEIMLEWLEWAYNEVK